MKNYQCRKCGTLIQSDRRPHLNGCPSGGLHEWVDLGECGATPYQCRKCGTLIQNDKRPYLNGCPSGGLHEWIKLR